MRRWMLLVALAALPGWAQEGGDRDLEVEEEIEAWVPPGRLVRGDRDGPAVFLRLREGGLIQVKSGEDWTDATLDDCAAFLRKAAEKHDLEMRKTGRSGYEVLPGGAKASKLFVAIDVDPTVPWQHVQWLMMLAAEQKFRNLDLSDGTRKLLASLPVDEPPGPMAGVVNEIYVSTHVVGRKERMGKWGERAVARPTQIRYRFGEHETGDIAVVAKWIAEAKKAAAGAGGFTVVGQIKAGHKVPFGKVLEVMDLYVDKEVTAMHFFGTSIPNAELRKLPRLPYPEKNYPAAD